MYGGWLRIGSRPGACFGAVMEKFCAGALKTWGVRAPPSTGMHVRLVDL